MVMKICPKWKMDSAAELAVKNWSVQKKYKKCPLTGSRYLGGMVFRRRDALRINVALGQPGNPREVLLTPIASRPTSLSFGRTVIVT